MITIYIGFLNDQPARDYIMYRSITINRRVFIWSTKDYTPYRSITIHRKFLDDWYEKDGFDYLFSLLLECQDNKVRTCVANFLTYILVKLKSAEKDYLFEP